MTTHALHSASALAPFPPPPSTEDVFDLPFHKTFIEHGGFGHVYVGDDEQTVHKIVDVRGSPLKVELARREVEHLSSLQGGDHVVRLLGSVFTKTDVIIVLERGYKDLQQSIMDDRCPRMEQVRPCFRQIADAVAYLHRNGVAHRDIKMENILVMRDCSDGSDPEVKLIDFDLSVSVIDLDQDGFSHAAGTPSFAAPEMMNNRRANPFFADRWSMGVVLYSLLFWDHPWEVAHRRDHSYEAFASSVLDGSTPFDALPIKCVKGLGQDHALVLNGLLHPTPQMRPSAGDVLSLVKELAW